MQTVADLEQACANTERLIRGTTPDQWANPTPCTQWDLRTVANHATWVLQMMAASTHGAPPPHDPASDVLGADAGASFAAASAAALAGFKERGTEGTIRIPVGELPVETALSIAVVDCFVHGWDIAQATKQDARLDPELSVQLLEWVPAILPGVRDRGAFGPEIAVAGNAAAPARLLALLGRQP